MLMEKIKLEADEKIIFQVRKHWFILFVEVFSVSVAAIFPAVVYLVITQVSVFEKLAIELNGINPAFVGLYAAWLIVLWMVLFNLWTNYYLDLWTLTNKRLIAVDQKGLFHRHTSSFRLERLQDMSVEFHGLLETLLDFGTLQADTAGSGVLDEEHTNNFRAKGLPHPRELKAKILECSDNMMKRYHNSSYTDSDGL